ncbi:MAG: acetyltransferase [Anaerolineae bacterium]|nr:acetyltransferase [Anaerolineae bacterium]
MNVIIIGAGGHGQVVADILQAVVKSGRSSIRPIGYLDDQPAIPPSARLGLPVLGPVARLSHYDHQGVIVAIGHNATRSRLIQQLCEQGEQLISAIHPTAIVGGEVIIEAGTVVCAGAIINPGSHIGRGVILNTGCTVDHHNRIGAYVHIAPGVHLGGDVTVGEGTLVGIGATVMPQSQVGVWSIVGAGAVVTTPVADRCTVVGVPARPI